MTTTTAATALRERVVELEAIVKDGVRRAENCMKWQARAEAAEAHVVELEGALEIIAGTRQPIDNLMSNVDIARAVLSAMPAMNISAERVQQTGKRKHGDGQTR